MGLFNWSSSSNSGSDQLPDIFPIPVTQKDFVQTDCEIIYARILTDVIDRTTGIPEKNQKHLWDNCVKSEKPDGLITLLAKAMVEKRELFLVLKDDVLREATEDEKTQIKDDYDKKLESKTGVFVSFKNYKKSDMIKFYSALEYCTVGSLYKSMNLAKAIQLKFDSMRASTALSDSGDIKKQAVLLAQALEKGLGVAIDAKDIIEVAKIDMTATNSATEFIDQKRSLYLGMPASWISGLTKTGLSDSGEGNQKDVERGLKPYFVSIIKPVCQALFGVQKLEFKTEDFTGLSTDLEMLKTLDVVSEDLMSMENKLDLVNKRFGFPKGTKGDPPKKPVVTVVDPNNPNPLPPQQTPTPA